MRKQFFFIVTALFACIVSVDATLVWNGTSALWTSGDGTQVSPFLLEKPEHLSQLSKNVSNGTNYEGKWFRMTEDFDMDGTSSRVITPIGKDDTHAFKGHFDGNGHAISNVLLNCMSTQYCAMFGYVDGATIENLKVENVSYFTGSSTLTYSAILSAYAKGGTFSNITTDGNMTINDGVYCGALVGYVENGASIRQCVNLADIALNATNQNAALGGIVGYNKEGATLFMTETVNEGTLALNVVSSDNSKSDESAVGGLLGMTSLAIQIEKSFSKGAISADIKHNHNRYFTITTGSSNYSTSRRSTTGRIGTTKVFYYHSVISAGGLVGKISNGAEAAVMMSIAQCGNTGNITITNTGTYSYVTTNAGGLIGSIGAVSSTNNSVLSCYAKCDITIPTSSAVQNNAPKRKFPTIPGISFPGVISGTIPVGTGSGGSSGGVSVGTTATCYHYAAGVLGDKLSTFNIKVQNCYYAGSLVGHQTDGLSVDVINDYSNNYYLDACGAVSASTYGAALNEETMKSNAMPMVLNNDGDDIFVKDDLGINDGYPIFAYQLPQKYTLTLLADAEEGVVSGGGEYDKDASVTITATPKTGYRFLRWSDGNTDNPRTLTLTNDLTLTAEFEAIKYMITAISSDELKGTVSGSGEYAYMSETEISATPAEGYIFKQWSDGNTDNPRTITLTQDTTLIAEFDAAPPTQYTLTLSVNDSDMGMVSGVAGTYDDGTEVTITAMPKDLYLFRRWSDGVTDNPRVLNMDNDISLIAIFTPVGSSINEHSSGIGSFSVSSSKKVTFSPGNVQYQASSGTWRFAEHQWDYVGNGNYGTVYQDDVKSQNSQVGSNYSGWIDYFGWGTGNAPTKVRSNYKDYLSFTDWGTNAISNGGNKAGMWYTLSKDEWSYLLHGRDNYDKLFGLGTVAGVNGIIILPDDWSKPQGLSFSPSVADGLSWNESYYIQNGVNHYSDNTYTVTQWEKMEASGAVFLPASGSRSGYVGTDGSYWTSTQDGTTTAHALYFYASYVNSQRGLYALYYGFSVRLVRTLPNNPTFTITFSNDDGTVLQSSPVRYGVVPSYNGSTPTKPSTAQYTYTFNGWNKDIVSVTSDATYTATYSRTKNKYTVVFYDADGVAMLGQQEVEYGSSATAPDVVIPECRSLSWDKDFSNVTEDLIVKVVWQYIPMASGYCGAEGDNLTWELSCDSVLTISGEGAMADGNSWQRSVIKFVIINDGVTSIGSNAFKACRNMTDVTISNSVTNIGERAFYDCNSLISVTIPNSVTDIGNSAFAYCNSLTSISIGNNVTNLGENVFSNCSGLVSVTIPNSVTSIESSAFSNDTNLLAVHISDIDAWCRIDFKQPLSNPLYYAHHLYLGEEEIKDLIIPNSVTNIGDYTFSGYSGLTSVTIPNSVTNIGNYTFSECSGLASVAIPNSVIRIGDYAFTNCSSLASVSLPNSVTSIGDYAFSSCSGLTSVTNYATTPQTIDSNVFYEVDKSIPLYVPCASVDAYKAVDQWKDFTNILPIDTLAISYSVTSAGGSQGTVTITEEQVYCDRTEITCRANAAEGYHFLRWSDGNTDNPRSLTLTKDTVLTAEFEQDKCLLAAGTCGAQGDNLTWELSCDGILTISGTGAMADYNSSSALRPMEESTTWRDYKSEINYVYIDERVTSIGNNAFSMFGRLKGVTMPNSVTCIGSYALYGCNNIQALTLSSNLETIGADAFAYCGFESLEIPDKVTSIGSSAFFSCLRLKNINIPSSVTTLGNTVFDVCQSLESVTIPRTVTSMGYNIFMRCTNLKRIVVEEGNPNYDSRNDCNAIIETSTNTLVATCKNTQIPSSVSVIGSHAYFKYDSTSFIIPDNIIKIDDNAFNQSKLEAVVIPDGVTYIGEHAFSSSSAVKSVTIPESVSYIGEFAFILDSIESVNFGSSVPPTFGMRAFPNTSAVFYVPCGTKEAYLQALNQAVMNAIMSDKEKYLIDSSKIIERRSLSYTYSSIDEAKGTVSVTEDTVTCDSVVVVLHAEPKPGYMFTTWNNGREERDMRITIDALNYDGYHFEAFFYDSIGFTNLPIIEATPYTVTVAALTNLPDMDADLVKYALAGFEVWYQNGNGVGGGFIAPCDVRNGYMQTTIDLHHQFAADALQQYPFDEVYYRPYYTSETYYLNEEHPIWNEHIVGEWVEVPTWKRDNVCRDIATTVDVDLCEGESFNQGGGGLTPLDGGVGVTTMTRTYQSRLGCDSVVTYHVYYYPKYAVTLYDTICSVDNYVFGGRQLTEPGSYTDSLTSIWGCDSIVTLVLNVNELNELRETATVCATELPYLWRGESIKESGTYTVTEDCNVYTLVLKVNELNELRETATVCATELPYLWRGESIKEGGTYTVTEDCNVYTLVLTVKELNELRDTATVCATELPYQWRGESIKEGGTYTVTKDCNVYTLVLTVNELNELRETATVCATELPYLWRGESIKEGGTYTVTEDCNVYTLVLTVKELNELRETATVCATELPYLWRGESIKESGTYTITEDCNVHTLVLTVDECEPVETGHWEIFRRAVVPREQGTICLPYDVSEDGIFGADVYRISGFSNAIKNYVLYEPVHSMQAGYAYIFEVLPDVHEIAFMYYADGNPSPAVMASQGNPLQGFIGETPNERLDLEIGVYFLYNKQWRLIDYPGYYILSNRAYLILEYVTPYGQVPSSVAARSRVVSLFDTTEQSDWTGASDDYSTPTDVEQTASQTALPKKVLIDGHLYVLMPDGTLYSVTGQKTNR